MDKRLEEELRRAGIVDKIVQICTTPPNPQSYGNLFALSLYGRVFRIPVYGNEWTELKNPIGPSGE
jgi:hypothetical protein